MHKVSRMQASRIRGKKANLILLVQGRSKGLLPVSCTYDEIDPEGGQV